MRHALAPRLSFRPPAPRRPAPPSAAHPIVQRKACACGGTCPHCRADAAAEHEADALGARTLQMKPADGPAPIRAAADGAPASNPLAGLDPGRPLPPATRAFFEPRLGLGLSEVRVHDGPDAAARAESFGAQAFTFGRDLVFGPGRFAPDSAPGRELLAHELVHVAQQSGARPQVQRKDMTDADRRTLIEGTIEFLNQSARFYAEPRVTVDAPLFDRVLTAWYSAVVRQEEMIDKNFAGDADMKARLHAAYSGALAVLVPKFAAASSQPEAAIYAANSGRIPMWAWPDPHRLQAGISTPLASGQAVDPLTGNATSTVGGIAVTLLPDASDASITEAETRFTLLWTTQPSATTLNGDVVGIGALTTPTLSIQTFFGTGVTGAEDSAYGRGTTAEDVAGATVTPRSGRLGHHEGEHGLAFQRFVAANPVPAFTLTASAQAPVPRATFDAAVVAYNAAMCAYQQRMQTSNYQEVDCAGTPRTGTLTVTRVAPCNDTFTLTC